MAFPQFLKINHRSGTGRILILSDLHIWGAEDPLYRALIRFMSDTLKAGDNFFIAGDLFDIFIGPKKIFSEKYQELLQLIKSMGEQGINFFYLEGNHDFLLKEVFSQFKNVEIFSEEIVYQWDKRILYFCHGDRINTKDYGYHLYRAVIRNSFTEFLIDLVPGRFLDYLGRSLSATSRKYSASANDETVQLFRNFACDKISKGYDFVIMGHSHYLDDIKFKVDNHHGQYVNVGFPRRDCQYLEILPGEQFITQKSWQDYIQPLRPRAVTQSPSCE